MTQRQSCYVLGAVAAFTFFCVVSAETAPSARETPIVRVVKENAASVVNISTERMVYLRERRFWGGYDTYFDQFFDQFYGPRYALKFQSVGSGVIVDEDGLIVTNAHVVSMATDIIVIFSDGSKAAGDVVFKDPFNDIALIKVDAGRTLKAVTLGTTEDLLIGETAIAIGNPLGLENSVTAGVISGDNRAFYAADGSMLLEGLLQTDAPINPGNSGGALFNLDGEMIGINVAVVQHSQSIGFAIPVEVIKDDVENYRQNKQVTVTRKTPARPGQDNGQSNRLRYNFDSGPVDPLDEIESMRQRMLQMFKDHASQWGMGSNNMGVFDSTVSFNADMRMEEANDSYRITLQIDNLDQYKINVEATGRILTISGRSEAHGRDQHAAMSRIGSFMRTIAIPEDADVDRLSTQPKGNTIVITLPKYKKK